jgi:hypothetical protein
VVLASQLPIYITQFGIVFCEFYQMNVSDSCFTWVVYESFTWGFLGILGQVVYGFIVFVSNDSLIKVFHMHFPTWVCQIYIYVEQEVDREKP